jgi:hypothetical protein
MPAEIAAEVAGELVDEGAIAVTLTGSHARGDAQPYSDIDLIALGEGPDYRLEQRHGHLVAITWMSVAAAERSMLTPRGAGMAVPGWRNAVLLVDPEGEAARLQDRARRWNWSDIPTADLDQYVAEELTGLAEEVHKLVNLLDSANLTGAAVQRSILSFRIGAIVAVLLRVLYVSENDLWNLVSGALDKRWHDAQMRALGIGNEPFDETCRAAADLYRLAIDLAADLLDDRQRAVTAVACGLRAQSWSE